MIQRRHFLIGSFALAAGASCGSALATGRSPAATRYRPQIHYAPPGGFMNDPNGLLFCDGEYHLFYQFNPTSPHMGNVHWGHAVSRDLLSWQTLDIALNNTENGQAFSGSAVVDRNNSSRLFAAGEPGITLIYTRSSASLQTQELAISHDRGRTFTPYPHNPILDIGSVSFRDPKVFWYAADNCWIMVVVASREHKVLFYRSSNLTDWQPLSEFSHAGLLGIDYECPDLVEVPLAGGGSRWVLFVSINPGAPQGGSTVQYFVGDFDGTRFTAEDRVTRLMDFGKDFYAFQTFSGISGAPVGLAWLSNWQYANEIPASPGRGMMTLPRKLGLRKISDDWQLTQEFIDLSPLQDRQLMQGAHKLAAGASVAQTLPTDRAIEIRARVKLDGGARLALRLLNTAGEVLEAGVDASSFGGFYLDRTHTRGFQHRYFVNRFSSALPPDTRETDVHIILDRSSIELLGEGGSAAATALYFSEQPFNRLEITALDGNAELTDITISTLHSA